MSTYRFDGQYPITKKKKRKKKGKKKEKNKKTTHPHFELFFPTRRYTEYVDCSTDKKKPKNIVTTKLPRTNHWKTGLEKMSLFVFILNMKDADLNYLKLSYLLQLTTRVPEPLGLRRELALITGQQGGLFFFLQIPPVLKHSCTQNPHKSHSWITLATCKILYQLLHLSFRFPPGHLG